MDENILESNAGVAESGLSDAELGVSGTESGSDVVESDTDCLGSGSGSDGVESVEESTEVSLFDSERGGVPVYIVDDTEDEESLYDDELGGVPVVLVDDNSNVAAYASNSGTSYQLPTYYCQYFSGVLANIGDTDYVAFCTREYPYNNNYWVEHYRLVYDLTVDSGGLVGGSYPCIDIYRYSDSAAYTVDEGAYTLTDVPYFAYGSFGHLSDLREGVSPNEGSALLFFAGFAVVFCVVSHFFGAVFKYCRRSR